ncbi:hypothetical protein VKT23_012571 [Stygiomarasmius scandens]|uniref:Uncharacterized protein n=1 Tax=Marasmiellus scandens TaxID=2682957 RepID=A0ABR1J5I2_9AGAR
MSSSLLIFFLGAIQASLVILLTIFFGFIAHYFSLLSVSSSNDLSKLCAYVFMPALLATGIGKELNLSTIKRYLPVIIWGFAYPVISMVLGYGLRMLCNRPSPRHEANLASRQRGSRSDVPQWIIPAMAINNSTSLPLVLIQSFESTGILERLMLHGESQADALSRAKSYLLVNAMISNILAFILGPILLAQKRDDSFPVNGRESDRVERSSEIDESAPLLNTQTRTRQRQNSQVSKRALVSRWIKCVFSTLFRSPIFLSAVTGVILGLTPQFHTAFFAPPFPLGDGIFSGWLTASIANVGDLFASLQLVVVGSKLAMSISKMRRGEESGDVPVAAIVAVFFVRFIFWPIVSIVTVYTIVKNTNLLFNDPILWFTLMIMPTGPPAAKLSTLADVGDSGDKEKHAIAKFLTMSYVVSPIICLAVVGSLKASEKLM